MAITLATNMAGRGTDIKLKEGVRELKGLHVIGTTRHSSRRIDRQLRGRSGRLGDPGSSKFFVAFEDSLMRLFASPRMTALLQRFRPPEGEPISAKVLNKSIETAQKRVEQRNYTMRKHTLEYDDVMNRQRQEVYAFRNDLLFTENPHQIAEEILESVARHILSQHPNDPKALQEQFPISFENLFSEKEKVDTILSAFQQKTFYQRQLLSSFRPELNVAEKAQNVLLEVIRSLMIRRSDQLWQEHLLHIDHLRSDVHMRTVGQKDPLLEFKHESFHLFEALSLRLRQEIAKDLFRFEMMPQQHREAPKRNKKMPTLIQGA